MKRNVLIIDGQGGKMGRQLTAALLSQENPPKITVVGTNAIATANMLKAGDVQAATGENAAIVGSRKADVIAGPVGIVMADALLGEITEKMAAAISQSDAFKVLLPVNRCGHYLVGVSDKSLSSLITEAAEKIMEVLDD